MKHKHHYILFIILTCFNSVFFFSIMFIMPNIMEHDPSEAVVPVTITFTFLMSVYFNIYYLLELLFSDIVTDSDYKTVLKKRMLKIVIAICFIILIEFLFQPYFFYQSLYIYVKNSFIYLNLLIVIYYIGKIVYDQIFERYSVSSSRKKIVNLYFLISVVCLLLIISNMHLYYIDHYTIPPLYGCSYYDTDLRLIYNSQYEGTCPDLKNLTISETDNGSELSFTVYEEVYESDQGNTTMKHTFDSNIKYHYDSDGRVTDYRIEAFNRTYNLNNSLDSLIEVSHLSKQINNTYDTNIFTSIHTTAETFTNNQVQLNSVTSKLEYNSIYNQKSSKEATVEVTVKDLSQSIDGMNLYYVSIWDLGEPEYYITRIRDNKQLTIYYFMNNEIQKHINNAPKEIYQSHYNSEAIIHLLRTVYYNNKTYHSRVFDNQITMTSKDETYQITSTLLKTDYGYILKHYNHKRDELGRYYKYDGIYSSNATIPYNSLSIPLKSINDYSNNLYNISEASVIYQKNPLIFEK
ncbi:hypothetical protein [Haloplasma contractile]|uniref:Uncharacterized protein n=1 Tax=Haloplasma contractile SSD-17B TaxID=1033810 RepID=F7PTN7_9MOLU|nr:hypothetical protein [Haloplasma contractile]ERJ12203.1 hypothetical protein HLPCO_001730 [Haloplasma contractile SSD-17B]